MDKLEAMRVFLEVDRHGSFSKAAEALHLSKAMVSRHVGRLEQALGTRLLNRTTRSQKLTEAGRAYRDRVREILDDIEETELAVTSLATEPRGNLRVMAPTSFGAFHLARAVPGYCQRYPQVHVDLVMADRVPDMVAEGLDVAIHVGRLGDSTLVARRLADTRVVVCAAPEYLERHGTPHTLEQLADHNCLVFNNRPTPGVWTFAGTQGETGARVHGNLQSNNGDALRIAAIRGCGLAQLPAYMVGLDISAGRLTAVLQEFEPRPREVHALYLHRRHLSAKVRTFIDYLYVLFQPVPYWQEWTRA